ncbi:uncharacterized protein LOC129591656 [Paramacrobiotus metropolitanus]|uniref:uncharacterized protein LOC129591656 n=1 Tax=Paramacrobiotus metropolitanus TaxID=2943436 RepID=UPI00244647EA|nr:uncharacterized protein LOC129591656 [Paramacrobiotus metropolitanus]
MLPISPQQQSKNFHIRWQSREYDHGQRPCFPKSPVDVSYLLDKQRIVCLESLKCPPEFGYCTGAAFVHDNHNMVVMKTATGHLVSASVNRVGRSRILHSQCFTNFNCRDTNLQALPTNSHRVLSSCLGCSSSLYATRYDKHRARIWNVLPNGQFEALVVVNNFTLAQAANVHENLLLGCTNVQHLVNRYSIMDYVSGQEVINFGNIPASIDWPGLPAWSPLDTTVALLGGLWDTRSGKLAHQLVMVDSMLSARAPTGLVHDAKIGDCHFFHPGGTTVVVGPKIFDIRTCRLLATCPGFADAFIQFTEMGNIVYSFDMIEPAPLLMYNAKDFTKLGAFTDFMLHVAVVDKHDDRILAQPSNVKSPVFLGLRSVDNPAPQREPSSGNSSVRCQWSHLPNSVPQQPPVVLAHDSEDEDDTDLSVNFDMLVDESSSAESHDSCFDADTDELDD